MLVVTLSHSRGFQNSSYRNSTLNDEAPLYLYILVGLDSVDYNYLYNESTKVQNLGVFLGIDRSMSWKQRCYVSVSYVSM